MSPFPFLDPGIITFPILIHYLYHWLSPLPFLDSGITLSSLNYLYASFPFLGFGEIISPADYNADWVWFSQYPNKHQESHIAKASAKIHFLCSRPGGLVHFTTWWISVWGQFQWHMVSLYIALYYWTEDLVILHLSTSCSGSIPLRICES